MLAAKKLWEDPFWVTDKHIILTVTVFVFVRV